MDKLFGGKYLLARYTIKDNVERLVAVGECAEDIGISTNVFAHRPKNAMVVNWFNDKIYLIDCTEPHNDIFSYEDEEFLRDIDFRSKTEKIIDYAHAHNLGQRTVWHRLQMGRLHEKEL